MRLHTKFGIAVFIAVFWCAVWAYAVPPIPETPHSVAEEDGTPTVWFPYQIKVSNGDLTDNADGTVSIATASGASGESTTVTDTTTIDLTLTVADITADGLYTAGDSLTLTGADFDVDDDFVKNSASDIMGGTLTADGLTLGANENITLGAQTLDHNGTDFVFDDSVVIGGTDQSTFSEGLIINSDGGADEDDDFAWESTTHDPMIACDAGDDTCTMLGAWDFGGATSLEIPQSKTASTSGHVTTDPTTGQLRYGANSIQRVIAPFYEFSKTLETPVEADDDIPFWHPKQAITITDVYCECEGATSIGLIISDGTNALEEIICDEDGEADDGSIANGTFIANERMEADMGTLSGAPDWLSWSVTYVYDAD